ncbi:MAG: hypothetical protein ABI165_03485 [Bryobacteraceae bacterium]
MSRQSLIFFGIGLAVIAAAVTLMLWSNKGSHLVLQGKILKVRTLSLEPDATIAAIDFRVTNPSNFVYMIKDAVVRMDTADGKTIDADTISRDDTDRTFAYYHLLGPKYNQTLIERDRIEPHQTTDRMIAVRIPAAALAVDNRKGLHLKLDEMDGGTSEIREQR